MAAAQLDDKIFIADREVAADQLDDKVFVKDSKEAVELLEEERLENAEQGRVFDVTRHS